MWTKQYQERGKGDDGARRAGIRRGDKKAYAGRGCTQVPGVIRGGGSQYGSAPTIFVTAGTEV